MPLSTPKSLKIPRSVLVAIITPTRETLLIERADFAGFWQSVTGSQEHGETFFASAARELQEETGFIAGVHGQLIDLNYSNTYSIYPHWRHRYPHGITHNFERCFAFVMGSPQAPTLAPAEHTAYQWLPIQKAIQKVYSWSNVCALKHLESIYFNGLVRSNA